MSVIMLRFRLPKRVWRLLLLGLIAFGIAGTMDSGAVVLPVEAIAPTHSVAVAQIPAPDLSTSPTDTVSPPSRVRRIGDTEITVVSLRGEALFEIASPTVLDRENPGELIPVELRAWKIEERLGYIVSLESFSKWAESLEYDTVYDPETLQITVGTLNGQTVLMASDETRTEPQALLTVTRIDAEYHGLPQDELAANWRDRLQIALTEQLRSRQPEAIWGWARFTLIVLASLVGFSVLSWTLRKQLKHRKQLLQARQKDEAPDQPNIDEPNPAIDFRQQLEILEAIRSYFDLDQRLRWVDFFQWLLVWVQIIAWIIGISFIAGRFPLWRFTVEAVLFSPLLVFLVWGAAGLVKRLMDLGINRAATFWRTQNAVGDVKRRSLRITTIANVLRGLATFLTYFVAILFILELIGFSTSSVLAFGALIGFAISLASQNLIRDLVNGFLILLEDQYAIGDVIAVDGVDGFVENLNLRTTQLRNGEGRLIVLPNSRINRVENLTRSWARVDHTVEVAADTNPRKALDLIRRVANEIYHDPDWRSLIVDPPEVLGIDEATHAGLLIRTWIKTEPLQQWAVGREFRLRVLTALEEEGIELGMPQQKMWYPSTENSIHQPFLQQDIVSASEQFLNDVNGQSPNEVNDHTNDYPEEENNPLPLVTEDTNEASEDTAQPSTTPPM